MKYMQHIIIATIMGLASLSNPSSAVIMNPYTGEIYAHTNEKKESTQQPSLYTFYRHVKSFHELTQQHNVPQQCFDNWFLLLLKRESTNTARETGFLQCTQKTGIIATPAQESQFKSALANAEQAYVDLKFNN